jgi:hypothetical protein
MVAVLVEGADADGVVGDAEVEAASGSVLRAMRTVMSVFVVCSESVC